MWRWKSSAYCISSLTRTLEGGIAQVLIPFECLESVRGEFFQSLLHMRSKKWPTPQPAPRRGRHPESRTVSPPRTLNGTAASEVVLGPRADGDPAPAVVVFLVLIPLPNRAMLQFVQLSIEQPQIGGERTQQARLSFAADT